MTREIPYNYNGTVRIGYIRTVRISATRTIYTFDFPRYGTVQRDCIRSDNMKELSDRLRASYGIELVD
jgi:hypothetical protein